MANKYIISFAPGTGTDLESGAAIKPKRDIITSAKELGFIESLPMEDLFYNRFKNKKLKSYDIIERIKRKWNFSRCLNHNLNFFYFFF